MIAGFPFPEETGFLHQAVRHLRQTVHFTVDLEIIHLGGFPVDRARKHLASKVLVRQPDVVVLQFGSTDVSAPLRRGAGVRQVFKKGGRDSTPVSAQPPVPLDLIKWELRNLGSEILQVPPTTSLKNYLSAVLDIVDQCRSAGTTVVVVSPFVLSSNRSNRFARRYTRLLAEKLPRTPGVHFFDAHALLSRERRSEMLLRDGFHLSARAHQKLGIALGELLAKIAECTPKD